MNSPVLSLEKLATGYGSGIRCRTIAHGLTASLPPASVTALIGANGVGKSTLLRTIAGLQPAIEGHVRWEGRDLAAFKPKELARLVSVVLTFRPASDGLTAREVVELGRTPYTGFSGRLNAKDHDIVDEAFHLAQATALAYRQIAHLSDGERQRVMIAKALAQQTPVILLDEPTAFLDFPGKAAVLQLLCKLATEHGKTILISTHDLELTFGMVSRLWLLTNNGITEGTPRELAANGALGRSFNTANIRLNAETLRFDIQSLQY